MPPHISAEFADVLDKVIQYHPRDRYHTAEMLLTALRSQPEVPSTPPSPPSPSIAVPPTVISTPPIAQPLSQPVDPWAANPSGGFTNTTNSPLNPLGQLPPELDRWNWGAALLPGTVEHQQSRLDWTHRLDLPVDLWH